MAPKIDLEKVQKYSTYLLIIGVLCVAVAGPVLTQAFSTWPVVPEGSKSVPQTSMTNIRDAYTYPHKIISDNQLSIKITSNEATSRIYLRVYTQAIYKGLYDAASAPGAPSQNFAKSIPTYGSSASSSSTPDDEFDSANDGSAIIEFGGDATNWYPATVQFIPGDYVVVVYGDNLGSGTHANFTIQISVDAFGRVAGRIVNTAGWGLVITCSVICLAVWVKKEVASIAHTAEVRV